MHTLGCHFNRQTRYTLCVCVFARAERAPNARTRARAYHSMYMGMYAHTHITYPIPTSPHTLPPKMPPSPSPSPTTCCFARCVLAQFEI